MAARTRNPAERAFAKAAKITDRDEAFAQARQDLAKIKLVATNARLEQTLRERDDEIGRLTLDLADAAKRLEKLEADFTLTQQASLQRAQDLASAQRLQSEMAGEARANERRAARAENALLGLAYTLGEATLLQNEAEDDDAHALGRREARAGATP